MNSGFAADARWFDPGIAGHNGAMTSTEQYDITVETVGADDEPTTTESPFSGLISRARSEVGHIEWRGWALVALANRIPAHNGVRVRTALLRRAGMTVGGGTAFGGRVRVVGMGVGLRSRITLGMNCWINDGCTFDASDDITLGNGVALGHEVMLLTSTHEIGPHFYRAGRSTNMPVEIGDGAWIGARSVVLPGVTIGRGAVVAAGSVVNRPVADNVLVAGVPARVVRSL